MESSIRGATLTSLARHPGARAPAVSESLLPTASRWARWAILLAGLLVAAPRAGAESWGDVFAGERDTTVFLGADGTLFRAPFDLGTREILWRGSGDAHVVRFVVGPAGRLA